MKKLEMNLQDVKNFIEMCESSSVEFYLDGGWGVDALLGKQTRDHEDLDVGVPRKDAGKLRRLLEGKGYKEIVRHDSSEWNYVLADDNGHQVDVHTYEYDENGHHVFGVEYPIESLTGKGIIDGHKVDCISPEWMIKFHSGYELDQNDYHDVKLLCEKFGLELPDEYRKFTQ